jgi:hypothetical protein
MSYVTQFGKTYTSMAEFEQRLQNFAEKHIFIEEHNASESLFKLGHNQMSDWSAAEYKSILTTEFEGIRDFVPSPTEGTYEPINWITGG